MDVSSLADFSLRWRDGSSGNLVIGLEANVLTQSFYGKSRIDPVDLRPFLENRRLRFSRPLNQTPKKTRKKRGNGGKSLLIPGTLWPSCSRASSDVPHDLITIALRSIRSNICCVSSESRWHCDLYPPERNEFHFPFLLWLNCLSSFFNEFVYLTNQTWWFQTRRGAQRRLTTYRLFGSINYLRNIQKMIKIS